MPFVILNVKGTRENVLRQLNAKIGSFLLEKNARLLNNKKLTITKNTTWHLTSALGTENQGSNLNM
jgi:hypothetical protein